MLVSCVLRLAPGALAERRLAGTLLLVETGVTTPFSSLDELLALLVPHPRPVGTVSLPPGPTTGVERLAPRGAGSSAPPSPPHTPQRIR